jgi:ribonuclease G
LTKGILNSIIKRWKKKYKLKLQSQASNTSHLVEYKFLDDQMEEIKL